MNKSTSLFDFGYNFLGPTCCEYLHALQEYCAEVKPSEILFLAREGHFFESAYRQLEEHNLIDSIDHRYLLVSRTFLFRITIADPRSWQWSLSHKFEGSLKRLLTGRFGFSHPQIEHIFSHDELQREWLLPEQQKELEDLLKKHLGMLKEAVNSSRVNYLEYLANLGLSSKSRPLMVDVGYSGTIQKLLTMLLDTDTFGIYFIATKQGSHAIEGNTAQIKSVFKHGVKMGGGYTMLDRSLLLESLLTSPQGQFIDIRRTSEFSEQRFDFYYGRKAYPQKNFHELNCVFDGARQAILDGFRNNVRYSADEIEMMFEQFAYHRKLFPRSTWALFDVDDAISGHANVNPLQLFGI